MAADGTSTLTRPAARRVARDGLGERLRAWGHPGRRAALADAAMALVLTRVLVLAAALVARATVGERPGAAAGFDPQGLTTPFGHLGDALVAGAARWDSVWFLAIARDGYGTDAARPAFFPLYGLLARAAGVAVGGPLLGGVAVSLACLGAALYFLRRLTALELGDGAARLAVWLTAAFPMAFFFSAVYSEALFLALSVGCVYAARTDRWAWTAVLGALATATRSAGVMLLVPLVLLAWEHRGAARWQRLAWLAVVPLGAASFSAWLAWRGAGALAPWHAQATWYRTPTWPYAAVWDGTVAAWDGVRQLVSGSREHVYFSGAGGDPLEVGRWNAQLWCFLVLGLVALAGVARRLPRAYGAYVLAALALPLSSPVGPQPLMSLPRFEAVLFPLAMWGGWWLSRRGRAVRALVLAISLAALAVFTGQFATWRWVA